jgi:hypothetical protein
MDVKSGVGGRVGWCRVLPAIKPNGRREANPSPKPAFNSSEMAVACVSFALFAIRFHIYFADTSNESVQNMSNY